MSRTVRRCAAAAALSLALLAPAGAGAATFAPADGPELQAALTLARANGQDDTITLDPAATYERVGGFSIATGENRRLAIAGEDSTLSATIAAPAVLALEGGTIDVTDVRIDAGTGVDRGIQIAGASTTATVARVTVRGAGSAQVAAIDGAQLTIADSLLLPTDPGAAGLLAGDLGDTAAAHASALDGRRLTIVGTDAGGETAAVAGDGGAADADAMSVTLSDSIVSAVPTALTCAETSPAATNTILVVRSALPAGAADVNTCADGPSDPGITLGADVITAAPVFVDAAAGDYRPRRTSPVVDAGATVDPLVGADLAGGLRLVGDAIDLGAYEYQRAAPSVAASASPATVAAGAPVTLTASGSDPDPGETAELVYSWTFSDGTSASGPIAQHTFPLIGQRTATVSVSDPTGQTAEQTVQIAVVAPPSVPEPRAPEPALDTTPPVITGLKVARTIRRGLRLPAAVTSGGQIAFTLSEPATVTIRFERTVRGRVVRAPGNLRIKLGAGARRLRFSGALRTGPRLARGSYRAVLVATDAEGNASRPLRASFRLR